MIGENMGDNRKNRPFQKKCVKAKQPVRYIY